MKLLLRAFVVLLLVTCPAVAQYPQRDRDSDSRFRPTFIGTSSWSRSSTVSSSVAESSFSRFVRSGGGKAAGLAGLAAVGAVVAASRKEGKK